MPCEVCGSTVEKYVYHARLGVAVCLTCPMTDVKGEDITSHTLLWADAALRGTDG